MNKLDSIYFQAITTASEGSLEEEGLIQLHKQALKFRTLENYEEAARYYERLFQVWRTLNDSGAQRTMRAAAALFKCVLTEYLNLLHEIGRSQRATNVEEALMKLSSVQRLG